MAGFFFMVRSAGWPEQVTAAALAVGGIGVSAYLTYVHASQALPSCAIGDCDVVNRSAYAQLMGLPTASWGLLQYVTLLCLIVWQALVRPAPKLTILGIFGLSLSGMLFSGYLTYVEVAVIHAICMWCMASAVLITLIFILSLRMIYFEFHPPSPPTRR